MFCIFCGNDTGVVNSRSSKKYPRIWRRRQCNRCQVIISTYETPDYSLSIKVLDASSHYEAFSDDKLFFSIFNALSHRNDQIRAARELTSTVISHIFPTNGEHVSKSTIAKAVYRSLKRFDRSAAVFYRAHHSTSL